MANDSFSQQALAVDPNFQLRVRSNLANVAWQVLEEPINTPGHTQRVAYARVVLSNLASQTASISPWLVERPNLLAFATSYSFPAGAVITAAGDPDIQSQLMSDWNEIAGVVLP